MPDGEPVETLVTYLNLEEPQASALVSVAEVACVEVQQDGWQLLISANVTAPALTRIERSADLKTWSTINFATEPGEPLTQESVEVDAGPVSFYLEMTAERYFYRIYAETAE